jgi:hypothetical protein
MEEETFRGVIARVLFRNYGIYDAEPVQSDNDDGAEAEDRLLVHRAESASSGHGLGRILPGMFSFINVKHLCFFLHFFVIVTDTNFSINIISILLHVKFAYMGLIQQLLLLLLCS